MSEVFDANPTTIRRMHPLCPLCGERRQRPLGPNPDFVGSDILRCARCGFTWSHPTPPDDELTRRYEVTYKLHHHSDLPAHYIPHKDARALAQRSFVLEHSDFRAFDQVAVLDIGCGIGSLLKAFGELPNVRDLVGIEPSQIMRDRARQRLPSGAELHGGSFSTGRFEDSGFDLIAGSHVLEHLADPIAFLEGVRSKVRPDGLLFLEVPHETDGTVGEVVAGRRTGLLHLLFFNRETLLASLRKAGWHVLHQSAFGPAWESISKPAAADSSWPRRVRRRGAQVVRRLSGRGPEERSDDLEAFATENDPEGVWLRVVAENRNRPIDGTRPTGVA